MKPGIIALLIGLGVLLMAVSKKVSAAGLEKIKRFEELRLKPYNDVGDLPTIGYGHLIRPDEDYLLSPNGISEAKAESLLVADLAAAERAVKTLVDVPLTQSQYDALVSLVFNIGASAFATSTMLKLINQGDYNGAAAEFQKWNKVNKREVAGLTARRALEQQTFLS